MSGYARALMFQGSCRSLLDEGQVDDTLDPMQRVQSCWRCAATPTRIASGRGCSCRV